MTTVSRQQRRDLGFPEIGDTGLVRRVQSSQQTRWAGVAALTVVIAVLLTIIVAFAVVRVITDWPSILDGTVPDDDFAQRYAAHPWLAYLHIGPGLVYLLGAPLQLSRRFRTRHYTAHRRMGRVLVACALLAGVLALVFGLLYPWGGALEASASTIFGLWFVICLVLGFRAIRRREVPRHRRWMIRAFAVGVGVGTIRIWVGLFTAVTIGRSGGPDELTLPEQTTFGLAFWLALSMHVAIGEWWLTQTEGGVRVHSPSSG